MAACGCGRYFGSKAALQQHQRDRARNNPFSVCMITASTIIPDASVGTEPQRPVENCPIRVTKNSKDSRSFASHDRWMVKGIGGEVHCIGSASLHLSGSETPVSSNGHCDVICSYNWVYAAQPTIYVPGGAPIYEPVSFPTIVQPDSGRHGKQQASSLPSYPFEAVFRAVDVMNSTFRFDSIDVLVNRNSLRKFYKFCLGCTQDSFRVNLYVVNETLIVERCVKRPGELLNGSTLSGFGHNFEQAVTRLPPGLLNSSAHHRVLRYKLGDLECAVRFEVDACSNEPGMVDASGDRNVGETGESCCPDQEQKVGDLEASFSSMALGQSTDSNYVPVKAISRGTGSLQANIIELKSCANPRKAAPNKGIEQLWFGRTRRLITGYHDNGLFTQVKVRDLEEKLVDWENTSGNQTALRKMAVLLSRLRDAVGMTEGKSCVAIFQKGAKDPVLRIFRSTSGHGSLPDSIIEKFWKT